MNPERILGALVRDALMGGTGFRHRRHTRHRGAGSMLSPGMRGMLGMGALGVAIAAFEHFTKQQKAGGAQSFSGVPPVQPPDGGASRTVPPPPLPPLPRANAAPASLIPPPPPPPGSAAPAATAPSAPFAPATPPSSPSSPAQQEALLMIQAMVAAANCDYEIDADEKARIVRTMEEAGLDEAEKKVLLAELEHPVDSATLAARATTPALRRDVYLASEMAIDADTKAEQNYLARLARHLGLGDEEVQELRKILTETDGA